MCCQRHFWEQQGDKLHPGLRHPFRTDPRPPLICPEPNKYIKTAIWPNESTYKHNIVCWPEGICFKQVEYIHFTSVRPSGEKPNDLETSGNWIKLEWVRIKGIFQPKIKLCHHLLVIISFQTWMSFFLIWNREERYSEESWEPNSFESHWVPQTSLKHNGSQWDLKPFSYQHKHTISDSTDFQNIFHPYYVGNQMVLGQKIK